MKSIKDIILKLKTEYGNSAYVGVTGDRCFEYVSSELRRLWYSPDKISISNIDIFYSRVFDMSYPDYTLEVFEKGVVKLRDDLAREFALIIKNLEKGD